MERPNSQMKSQLTTLCPKCSASVEPVAIVHEETEVIGAYRCIYCREDFGQHWVYGFIKKDNERKEPTKDILGQEVCPDCLSQPGLHTLTCPSISGV